MAGQKSNYLEKALLDEVLGAVDFVAPVTVYLALFSVTPTGAGGGTEATGTGYARLAITNNPTNFPAAAAGSPATKSNGTTFTMATAGADWSAGANMVAWGLFDASSGGNLLYFGPITTPSPILSGNTPVFASTTLAFSDT